MNPFDLSGPQFLVFYIGVAVVVVGAVKLAIDTGEGGAPPALPLGDPYQIAWLRGGTPEAARIAVLSLVDRSLLVVDIDDLVIPTPVRSFVLKPIESAILARCARSRTAATDVLNDPAVDLILPDNSRDPELTQVLRKAQEKHFAKKQRR
jgi:uncharacterized protein (TIGR04222 family)